MQTHVLVHDKENLGPLSLINRFRFIGVILSLALTIIVLDIIITGLSNIFSKIL